jgi:ADP-ribose pyrophosphatase YjhB (NUDIX family)
MGPRRHPGDGRARAAQCRLDQRGDRPAAILTREPDWLAWARALQALAQTGLHYTKDPFDKDRYQQTRAIAAAMMAAGSGEPIPRILELFARDTGYATPKVAVRGAVFRDDRILLVRELVDGRWSLPGGWADVNETPAACIAREIREESGFIAHPIKLAAVLDRERQGHRPPLPQHVYMLYFICALTGGAAQTSIETTAVDFFTPDGLPELSPGRVTEAQIRRMFEHRDRPELPTDFD